jgi:hypothetical protein
MPSEISLKFSSLGTGPAVNMIDNEWSSGLQVVVDVAVLRFRRKVLRAKRTNLLRICFKLPCSEACKLCGKLHPQLELARCELDQAAYVAHSHNIAKRRYVTFESKK